MLVRSAVPLLSLSGAASICNLSHLHSGVCQITDVTRATCPGKKEETK